MPVPWKRVEEWQGLCGGLHVPGDPEVAGSGTSQGARTAGLRFGGTHRKSWPLLFGAGRPLCLAVAGQREKGLRLRGDDRDRAPCPVCLGQSELAAEGPGE